MNGSKVVGYWLGCLVLLSHLTQGQTEPAADAVRELTLRPAVSGLGIFDPSLAEAPQGERVWMSYSAVDSPSGQSTSAPVREVTTRLAYSDDRGGSWSDSGPANGIEQINYYNRPAAWINETSSLIHDESAPLTERWKLFWHHYLRIGERGHFQDGWIGYKVAATPQDLPQAREIKLFSGMAYNHDDDEIASSAHSPLAGAPAIALNQLNRELSSCAALTEPGGVATSSGIYLSLVCEKPDLLGLAGAHPEVILMKCAAPCRAAAPGAWTYISTLFRKGFSAPALFSQDGRTYLLITPISNEPWQDAYHGCNLYRFANLNAGTLEKDARGVPQLMGHFEGAPHSFNGACAFSASAPGAGLVLSQLKVIDGAPTFHIVLRVRDARQ